MKMEKDYLYGIHFANSQIRYLKDKAGDIACDHYHLYKDDIKLISELGKNTTVFLSSGHELCRKE